MEAPQSPLPKSTSKPRPRSRWDKQRVILLGGSGVVLTAVIGVVYGLSVLMKIDAFAKFRQGVDNTSFDATLHNFEVKAYHGDKQVLSAHVESGQIQKGTRTLEMTGVTGAQLTTEDGVKANIQADRAAFDMNTKDVVAPLGVQVQTDNATIKTQGLMYSHQAKTISGPGTLTGTIGSGNFSGQGVSMDLGKNTTKVDNGNYQGPVEQDPTGSKSWNIKSKHTVYTGKDQMDSDMGRAQSDDTIVYADKISYDRKNDILIGTGHVRYFGLDANMICDKVTIRRKESRALFEGSVTMLMKPDGEKKLAEDPVAVLKPLKPEEVKPDRNLSPKGSPERKQDDDLRDSGNLRNYPTAVRADKIDYYYKKGGRKADITGSPMARQELVGSRWRLVWADTAFYDGETERLFMKSAGDGHHARLKNSIGDDLRAAAVDVSTKKGDDSMNAEDTDSVINIDNDDVPAKSGGGG